MVEYGSEGALSSVHGNGHFIVARLRADPLKLRFAIRALQQADPLRAWNPAPREVQSALEWMAQRSPATVRSERESMLNTLEEIADGMWCGVGHSLAFGIFLSLC